MTAQSVLLCRAPHPRSLRGDSRFEGRVCGKRLQVVPFQVRPTYRVIHDWSEVTPGCIAVRCVARDCRAFTEYEIVNGPGGEQGDGAKVDEPSPSVTKERKRVIRRRARPGPPPTLLEPLVAQDLPERFTG